jgi:hypothetical protein
MATGEARPGGEKTMSARITTIAQSAWTKAQTLAVFALCIGAGTVLPLTLATIGFQAI